MSVDRKWQIITYKLNTDFERQLTFKFVHDVYFTL